MKTKLAVLTILFTLLCLAGWVGRGWAQKTNPDRKVWEYKVGAVSVLDGSTLQSRLNELGEEGWELVAVENVSYTAPPSVLVYLKRPKD